MKKSHAIALFKSGADLAAQLGISESAVSQWPEEAIPELRAFQIEKIVAERGQPITTETLER
jgi:biotin operon repressor